uniref:maestro heat-like repeat-containing protein family member 1 isoform X2 n=1 Tax=Myxine glutinosa TaxID=7769 RepID=UPI00358F9D33
MDTKQSGVLMLALAEAAWDPDDSVRDRVAVALQSLGARQPRTLIETLLGYLDRHPKLPSGHRTCLFSCMESSMKDRGAELPENLAKDLVYLATNEMIHSKDVNVAEAAAGLAVTMGTAWLPDLMVILMQNFFPGTSPNHHVVLTLGRLAYNQVYSMVPFLPAILGILGTMMPACKQDKMRCAFASALSLFSQAIQEYLANPDQASQPGLQSQDFAEDLDATYIVLLNSWLSSRDMKVRVKVVEALGHVTHLMPRDWLEEHIPRVVSGVVGLLKKQPESFPTTQALCEVLRASCNAEIRLQNSQVDLVVNALHPLVCSSPVDFSNLQAMKVHNEVLRCFTAIGELAPEHLMLLMQQRVESGGERSRVGSLLVLRHLINSAGSTFDSKKAEIMIGLKPLTQDTSLKVRRALLQSIVALAHHGYLHLDGGLDLVQFLVRQCAFQQSSVPQVKPKGSEMDHDGQEAIRLLACSVLHVLTTTVSRIEAVLWPYLLEFICLPIYSGALGAVCHASTHLANQNPLENGKVPKPHTLFIRLLVESALPRVGGDCSIGALRLMLSLAPSLHQRLPELWQDTMPNLISTLEGVDMSAWTQQHEWEDGLLKLLSGSLQLVSEETWIFELGLEMTNQLSNYIWPPQGKAFLCKCLGVTLRSTYSQEVVQVRVKSMLGSIRYAEADEREALAEGLSLCGGKHLDVVMARLEEFTRVEVTKKSGSFLLLLKDHRELDVDRIRATLLLTYGHLALQAPTELLITHLDSLLHSLASIYSPKEAGVRLNFARAVSLVARAVHPSHMCVNLPFGRKKELLRQLQEAIKNEPMTGPSYIQACMLTACADLLKLEPVLSTSESAELLKTAVNGVILLPAHRRQSEVEGSEEEPSESVTLASLNKLLTEMLHRNLTSEELHVMLQSLEPFLSSQEHERVRASAVVLALLQFYLKSLNVTTMLPFSQFGHLAGMLVPHVADPLAHVGNNMLEGFSCLLKIQLKYEGFSNDFHDEVVEDLVKLSSKGNVDVGQDEQDAQQLQLTLTISKLLGKRIPQDQLPVLMQTLLSKLTGTLPACGAAASRILSGLIELRGALLLDQVPSLLVSVHKALVVLRGDGRPRGAEEVDGPSSEPAPRGSDASAVGAVTHGALDAVCQLAHHHLRPLLLALLVVPLPFDEATTMIWRGLAEEQSLIWPVLDALCDMLTSCLVFDERANDYHHQKKQLARVPITQALTVTSALHMVLECTSSSTAAGLIFPRLFPALLMHLGSSINAKLPKDLRASGKVHPCRDAMEVLRLLLVRAGCAEVSHAVDTTGGWEAVCEQATHADGVATITRELAVRAAPRLVGLCERLSPFLLSGSNQYRLTTVALYAELVGQKAAWDMSLLDPLTTGLLGRLVDSEREIRTLCLRGLSNVAAGGKQMYKYSTTVVSALVAGMDDRDDPEDVITLEAMAGLARVLSCLQVDDVSAILVNVALRIRPFFEKERETVRAATFHLLGLLARFATGTAREQFAEQLHTNLASLLVHLNDEDPAVRKACKFALREAGPLLGSSAVATMFRKHLLEEATLIYGGFCSDLAKLVVQDFPDKVPFYVLSCVTFFKSIWPIIRGNAAMLVGFFMGFMPAEAMQGVSLEHVCGAVLALLKDPAPYVRAHAADALGLLPNVTCGDGTNGRSEDLNLKN